VIHVAMDNTVIEHDISNDIVLFFFFGGGMINYNYHYPFTNKTFEIV
jgi:hypothetical protein